MNNSTNNASVQYHAARKVQCPRHGLGCNEQRPSEGSEDVENWLMSAITHQPVLADVAMASLTMAVWFGSRTTNCMRAFNDARRKRRSGRVTWAAGWEGFVCSGVLF